VTLVEHPPHGLPRTKARSSAPTCYCSTASGCGQILQLAEQECVSPVYLIEEFYCEDPLEPPTEAQFRCVPRVPCPPR
jgi:hypothetical protein